MVRSYSSRGRGSQPGRGSALRQRGRGKLAGFGRSGGGFSRSRLAFTRPRGRVGGLSRAMAARRSGRPQQQLQQQRFRRGRGGRRAGGARGSRGRRGAGPPRGPAPATIEGLDAQLEAYMGEDVVKQRLDRDLDAYFSATATDSAAAAAPAPETDAGPSAMEVTMEASAL